LLRGIRGHLAFPFPAATVQYQENLAVFQVLLRFPVTAALFGLKPYLRGMVTPVFALYLSVASLMTSLPPLDSHSSTAFGQSEIGSLP
jgi:hypothetical protein